MIFSNFIVIKKKKFLTEHQYFWHFGFLRRLLRMAVPEACLQGAPCSPESMGVTAESCAEFQLWWCTLAGVMWPLLMHVELWSGCTSAHDHSRRWRGQKLQQALTAVACCQSYNTAWVEHFLWVLCDSAHRKNGKAMWFLVMLLCCFFMHSPILADHWEREREYVQKAEWVISSMASSTDERKRVLSIDT